MKVAEPRGKRRGFETVENILQRRLNRGNAGHHSRFPSRCGNPSDGLLESTLNIFMLFSIILHFPLHIVQACCQEAAKDIPAS